MTEPDAGDPRYTLSLINHQTGQQLKVELVDLPFPARSYRVRVNGEWARKVPVANKAAPDSTSCRFLGSRAVFCAVNRLYFGEQRDAAPNCHFARSRERSERAERHGRLRSEGSCERVGRRTSQISQFFP
jgi:hypothetical protein